MKITPVVFLFQIMMIISSGVFASGNDTLIRAGSVWKFRDTGSNQGINWRMPAFNDSAWVADSAELGYGDGDENTTISFGPDPNNKIITTYFRHTFFVPNDSIYKSLRINIKRDDGAVVYLNGIEVYRSNMPSDTIIFVTHAISTIYSICETEFFTTAIDINPLQSGSNVLAVEVHQNNPDGGDLSFDLSLIADSSAEVVRGPYLQMATPNSMSVCWRTSIPDISKVLYGTTISFTDSLADSSLVTDHVLNISGLLPNTKYFYAICSSDKIIHSDTGTYFYTAPSPGSNKPVRIWAFGDMGVGSYQQKETRDAFYDYSDSVYTNVILFLGDNAYSDGTDEQYTTKIFANSYEKILKKSVVYSTCGNHEYLSANAINQTGPYYDIFTFPKHGESGGFPSGNEAYYSFNYSNIHFVCLESNIDSFGLANVDSMLAWLETDLVTNQELWTIVYFHFPPYSKGYHNSDGNTTEIYCRENFNPILEKYNVDLVLGGHSHDYERSHLIKGHYGLSSTLDSTMIIDSSGGVPPLFYDKRTPIDSGTVYAVVSCAAEFTPVQSDWPHPAMYKSFSTNEYGTMIIDVSRDTMDVKFLTYAGTINDRFVILKTLPPPPDTLITRGPYLQTATSHSIQVCWRSSIQEFSKLYYGTSLTYSDSIILSNSVFNHAVNITGLLPETKYYYSVRLSDGSLKGDSSYYFYTAPLEGSGLPIRIWAMGDFGSGRPEQIQTRDAYYNYTGNTYTNILLWLGNNAGNSGSDYIYLTNVFAGQYENILRKSVVYSACGSSELSHTNVSNQTGVYYDIFNPPENGEAGGVASGSEAYYSFNYANAHFVCLETNIDQFGTANFNSMITWLYSDLTSNQQPWVIVYFHHPPYSKGFYDSDVNTTMSSVRANLVPILEFFNVDLVLSSHSRDYERSHLINGHFGNSSTFFPNIMLVDSSGGVPPGYYDKKSALNKGTVYVVAGSAGSILPVQSSWPHPAMYTSIDSVFGSLVIDINQDTMDVKFLTSAGNIDDHFLMLRDSTTTSISTIQKNTAQLNLFPDPVHSELNIQYFNNTADEIHINIINSQGKVLRSWKEKTAGVMLKKIDISQLNQGIYFVKLQSRNNNMVRSFIKQ